MTNAKSNAVIYLIHPIWRMISMMVVIAFFLPQACIGQPSPRVVSNKVLVGDVGTIPTLPSHYLLTAQDYSRPKLRGFNIGYRQDPQLGDDDFRDLARTHANIVRLIVPLRRCHSCSSFGLAPADMAYLEQVVNAGERHGFYVIITFQPEPSGEKAEYWTRTDLQNSICDIWIKIAKKYNNRKMVAGYDLINEPVVPPNIGGQVVWLSFASRLIEAIREVDPLHVIIVEPTPWAGIPGLIDFIPLPYNNIVYSFHFYEPYELTHQGLYQNKKVLSYPYELYDLNWISRRLDIVKKWKLKYGVPIYVGEFSIVRWAPDGSRVRYLHDVIGLFESEGWPWTYHSFRESPAWDSEMPDNIEREPHIRSIHRRGDIPAIKLLINYFDKNQ